MLWFNFILDLSLIFLFFLGMVMNDNELETKGNKVKPIRVKLSHNIYIITLVWFGVFRNSFALCRASQLRRVKTSQSNSMES